MQFQHSCAELKEMKGKMSSNPHIPVSSGDTVLQPGHYFRVFYHPQTYLKWSLSLLLKQLDFR